VIISKQKKICFLLPAWLTKVVGGSEYQVYLLSEQLLKNCWQIEVITNNGPIQFQQYHNPSIKYYFLKQSKSYVLNYFKILLLLFKTDSYFYYVRTDARIMRGALLLYSFLTRKKVIYALAGDDELYKNSYLKYHLSKRISLKRVIKIIDALICDFIIRFRKNKIDLIITQTIHQQKLLFKNKGMKSIVIPNSYIKINRIDDYNPKKKNIVLWVGNMREVKRPNLFIDLAKLISRQEWDFVMIGEAGKYLNKVQDNSEFIKFLGPLSYEKTIEWFKIAKILVNTSTTEGFPNTFIQAWNNNVLVISLVVDPDNVLTEDKMGLYAYGDFNTLKKILEDAIRKYKIYQDIITHAYNYSSNKYDITINTKRFEEELICLN